MGGALLVGPEDASCVTGVIFFNNVGYLGMCGHGTIGLIVTLAHLGKIKSGDHKIETPVGTITATLHPNGEVSVANVPSWRAKKAVTVNVPGFPEVDHVELFGPPAAPGANSRNFVQCPGKAYDRSPCGTGTSAKLACLAADGKLAEGATWIQESIIGSTFSGKFRWLGRATGKVEPVITGTAFVNAEAILLLNDQDPFCWGIR